MTSDFDAIYDRLKLPALRAEVTGATAIKTPRLYPASPPLFPGCGEWRETGLDFLRDLW